MRFKYLWNPGLPKNEIHNIENGLYSDEQILFLCETIMNSYRIRKKEVYTCCDFSFCNRNHFDINYFIYDRR